MSDCSDLIGIPFKRGSDLSDGHIDCIHLVYKVLDALSIEAPAFKDSWYEASRREILNDLYAWGYRIRRPSYTEGDVLLIPQEGWTFAVVAEGGVLYCNRHLERVQWSLPQMFSILHCFRSKCSYAKLQD